MKQELKDAVDAYNHAAAALQKATAKLEAKYPLSDLWDKVKEICDHPTVEKKSDYTPGGYLDRSYTRYWAQCTICGAKSTVRTEYGYYG